MIAVIGEWKSRPSTGRVSASPDRAASALTEEHDNTNQDQMLGGGLREAHKMRETQNKRFAQFQSTRVSNTKVQE
ncbi:MAG TPA: hypothetical protein VFY05_04235 [Candidatus Angelobacter sp.]|nr:hypothetical protein [Candidatus Angelobacter sp.]